MLKSGYARDLSVLVANCGSVLLVNFVIETFDTVIALLHKTALMDRPCSFSNSNRTNVQFSHIEYYTVSHSKSRLNAIKTQSENLNKILFKQKPKLNFFQNFFRRLFYLSITSVYLV